MDEYNALWDAVKWVDVGLVVAGFAYLSAVFYRYRNKPRGEPEENPGSSGPIMAEGRTVAERITGMTSKELRAREFPSITSADQVVYIPGVPVSGDVMLANGMLVGNDELDEAFERIIKTAKHQQLRTRG